jgi:hypothetical protein
MSPNPELLTTRVLFIDGNAADRTLYGVGLGIAHQTIKSSKPPMDNQGWISTVLNELTVSY